MWEKCVGCGEGLFAGDAFCGNCGRPAGLPVPAAREPDGLESARLAAPADDRAEVRIIPAAHQSGAPERARPGQAAPRPPEAQPPGAQPPGAEQPAARQPGARHPGARQPGAEPPAARPPGAQPAQARPGADAAAQESAAATAPPNGPARPDGPGSSPRAAWPAGIAGIAGQNATIRRGDPRRRDPHDDPDRGNDAAPRNSMLPGDDAGRAPGRETAGGPARHTAPRLSGPATLDPVRNPRYLMYVLRQAGAFGGIYLLIETVLLLCLLLDAAAGAKLGPALRLEAGSLWLVALVLAILFWLIPVPALMAEWSLVMEQGAEAAHTAFEHINSAFQAEGAPVDSLRVRTASRHEEGDREDLELRRGHFSGYISCFAHGRDLYVGWTFWLHMSPLRLLMLLIGRSMQDLTSRGDGIHRSLHFESTRALMAAMHEATRAGIDAASSELGPAGPQLARETTIDMNVRLG